VKQLQILYQTNIHQHLYPRYKITERKAKDEMMEKGERNQVPQHLVKTYSNFQHKITLKHSVMPRKQQKLIKQIRNYGSGGAARTTELVNKGAFFQPNFARASLG
jgi:hypothetical protein